MGSATGIAVLCCALASCHAFHIPINTARSAISSRRHCGSTAQQCYRSSSRRPRALRMTEEATESQGDAAVVVEEDSAAAAGAKPVGKGKGKGKRSGPNRQDLYKNQPKPV